MGKFIIRNACQKLRLSSRNTIRAKTRYSGVGPLLEAIVGGDGAAEYRCGTQVGEPAQSAPTASHQEFLGQPEAYDLLQQFCREN